MSTGARCQYRASELQPIADTLENHGYTRDMLKDLTDEEAEGMLIPRNLAAALRETAHGKPSWMKSGPVPQFSGFEDCDDPVKRSTTNFSDADAPKARHGFPTYETKPAGVTWVRAHGGFPTPLRDYEPKHPATIARVGLPVKDAQPWKETPGVGIPVREAPAPPPGAPASTPSTTRPLSARSHNAGHFAGSARVAPRTPATYAPPERVRHQSQDDRSLKSSQRSWASPRPSNRLTESVPRAVSGERVFRDDERPERSPSPRQRHPSPGQIRHPSPKQTFVSPRQAASSSVPRRESRHRTSTTHSAHSAASPVRSVSTDHQVKAVSFGPPPKSAQEKAAILNDFLAEWAGYGLQVEDKDKDKS